MAELGAMIFGFVLGVWFVVGIKHQPICERCRCRIALDDLKARFDRS